MLKEVKRPDKQKVTFTYDALGRRLTKHFSRTTTHFLWSGNVPLHEWKETFELNYNTGLYDLGTEHSPTTWIFEAGSFVPCGKIVNGKHYSIITDHLGTPIEAYNQEGELIWEREQDLYGNSRQGFAKENFRCPFKYQGQYYNPEIELCYNRFRYYHPEMGRYISEDPIGFLSGEPSFFAYMSDTNAWVDVLGLRALHYSEIEALDQRISELGMEDAEKGVYNFTNNIDKNYTGSAGTGNGTNTIRDRLMQHMRNDHLLVKDLDSLTIINMNDKSDKEVLMKEATTIKEHGGIGDPNVANERRPKGTDNIAKKNS